MNQSSEDYNENSSEDKLLPISIMKQQLIHNQRIHNSESFQNTKKKRTALGNVTNQANLSTGSNMIKAKDVKSSQEKLHSESMCNNEKSVILDTSMEDMTTTDISTDFYTPPQQSHSHGDNTDDDDDIYVTPYDRRNRFDIRESPQYAALIFEYMRSREKRFIIEEDYMSTLQTNITWNMRATLVDWLVELLESLSLNHESLYTSVKLVDMYLQKVKVGRENLQLVGSCAMFIAAKFDERTPVCSSDLCFLSDYAFNAMKLFKMERHMLQIVDFDLNVPSSYRFLRRFGKCTGMDMPRLTLARYILELTLLDQRFLKILASKTAAACLWMSFKVKQPNFDWNEDAVSYSGYEEKDLVSIIYKLNQLLEMVPSSPLTTIRKKYLSQLFFCVADVQPLDENRMNAEKSRIFSQQQS